MRYSLSEHHVMVSLLGIEVILETLSGVELGNTFLLPPLFHFYPLVPMGSGYFKGENSFPHNN